MRGTLKHAMDAGLVVSFTSNDHTDQQVLLDWQSQFVPQPGDGVSCVEEDSEGQVTRRLTGTVVGPRRVEIRRDALGHVSLWIRLVAENTTVEEVAKPESNGRAKSASHKLSRNGSARRLVEA